MIHSYTGRSFPGGGGAGLRDLGDEGARLVRRRRASPSLLLQVAQPSSYTRIKCFLRKQQ